jgi:hypothetical protein
LAQIKAMAVDDDDQHDVVDGSLSAIIGGVDPPNDTALEQRQERLSDSTGKKWRDSAIPHLRLILCLIEDDIQPKFLRRDYGLPRCLEKVGARSKSSTTVYELIADRWNSDTFNPILPSSNVHADFQQPTDCSYAKVVGLARATAKSVENHISAMRADLIQIIIRWESNGQCDSVTEQQRQQLRRSGYPVFGKLGGRTAAALDSRANFLDDGTPSYLLILWELADEHQLLASTLQRLANGVGAADASSAPVTVGVAKRHRGGRSRPTYSGIINNLSKTLETYDVDCSLRQAAVWLSKLIDQKRDYRLQQFRAQSPREIEYLQEVLDSIDVEMETCQTERRRLERKKQNIT